MWRIEWSRINEIIYYNVELKPMTWQKLISIDGCWIENTLLRGEEVVYNSFDAYYVYKIKIVYNSGVYLFDKSGFFYIQRYIKDFWVRNRNGQLKCTIIFSNTKYLLHLWQLNVSVISHMTRSGNFSLIEEKGIQTNMLMMGVVCWLYKGASWSSDSPLSSELVSEEVLFLVPLEESEHCCWSEEWYEHWIPLLPSAK